LSEEAVPASAPATSRLFVLPVTTRRWVLTDNTHTTMETTNFAILSTVIYGWQTISIHYSIFSCVTIYFLQFLRETQQTHSPQHLGTYKNTQTVVTLKLKMDENNLLCCGNKLVVMHFNFVATCILI